MWAKIKKNVLFSGAIAGNYLAILPLFKIFKKRFPCLPTAESEICIEGYPRSGNTFLVSAFLNWNKNVKVAHHSHLAGSVKYAIKHGQPAVVLVRRPDDAVSSVLAWDGLLNVTLALLGYIWFYASLKRHRHGYLVLAFEDIISAPDVCIERINHTFQEEFAWKEFNLDEDSHIRERLSKVDVQHERTASNSSLPNSTKQTIKAQYRNKVTKNLLFPYAEKLYLGLLDQ